MQEKHSWKRPIIIHKQLIIIVQVQVTSRVNSYWWYNCSDLPFQCSGSSSWEGRPWSHKAWIPTLPLIALWTVCHDFLTWKNGTKQNLPFKMSVRNELTQGKALRIVLCTQPVFIVLVLEWQMRGQIYRNEKLLDGHTESPLLTFTREWNWANCLNWILVCLDHYW